MAFGAAVLVVMILFHLPESHQWSLDGRKFNGTLLGGFLVVVSAIGCALGIGITAKYLCCWKIVLASGILVVISAVTLTRVLLGYALRN